MSYITYTDVDKEVADLTQYIPEKWSDTQQNIEDYVNTKIANAQSVVDAACRSRYSVPFSSPKDIIKSITLMLTAYYIMRPVNLQEEPPAAVLQYQADANSLLAQIESGAWPLDDENSDEMGSVRTSMTGVVSEFQVRRKNAAGETIRHGTFDTGRMRQSNRQRW